MEFANVKDRASARGAPARPLPSIRGLAPWFCNPGGHQRGSARSPDPAASLPPPKASCPPLPIVLSPMRIAAGSLGLVPSGPRGGTRAQQVVHEVLPRHDVCRLGPAAAWPGVERHPLDAGAGSSEQGDQLVGAARFHVPPPARRLGEEVPTGGPPGGEQRQRRAPPPTGTRSTLPPQARAAPPTPHRRAWQPRGGPVSDAPPLRRSRRVRRAPAPYLCRSRRHAALLIDVHTVCMLLWLCWSRERGLTRRAGSRSMPARTPGGRAWPPGGRAYRAPEHGWKESACDAKVRGGTVANAHLRMGAVADEIVDLADELGSGLIVVGSRGLGRMRRALAGSVSEGVLRRARCPVMVVRAKAGPPGRRGGGRVRRARRVFSREAIPAAIPSVRGPSRRARAAQNPEPKTGR
jgi:hypothetical protein